MNELRTLLLLELRSLYGINKHLHTKDKKEKSRYKGLLAAWAILTVMAFFYVSGLVYGLCILGLGDIAPAYLVLIASLLIVAFGLFSAGHRIFGQKGYDLLASMPVRTENLVLSRYLSLYLEDLALALVIMLPGTVVYGIYMEPGLGFYLTAAVGTLLIPAIPIVIAMLFGTVILAISARVKGKNMVQTVLMVLFVVAVVVGSFSTGNLEDISAEAFTQFATTIGALIGSIYPPAVWLGWAMVRGSIWDLLLFAGVSLAVAAVSVTVVSRCFHQVVGRLGNSYARHDYKIGALESRGLLKALYFREAKRYFSSSIYVTNTIIGPIMGTLMAVALCVSGVESVQSAFPVDITGAIPFAFGAIFCMMTTTSTAISMEGKQFWVVKSLPVPTKTLLDSKILLNLSLMLPFYAVGEAALIIALRPNVTELLWLVLIPALLMGFAVVFGIAVNLKFHSFDWEKEETVVKQSLSATLGGLGGFLLAAVLGIGVLLIPGEFAWVAKLLVCLLLSVGTALLYRKNNQALLWAL